MEKPSFKLRLNGKTAIFIDWANVYGWKQSLKKEVNPQKLYEYLKTYKKIENIYFYYGTDKHPKSKQLLSKAKRLGYLVVTKPVKYILVAQIEGKKIYKRKCDFDMEIGIRVHELLKKDIESFIFFSGDGDFEPLYQLLIKLKKQVIVIYAHGHLGKEVWQLKRGVFKKAIDKLEVELFE